MTDNKILALMYDFYNEQTLKGQNDDISYYKNQIKKYKCKNILVVGAGTGRVAIPLSKYANVTALDLDKERLNLLSSKCNNTIKILNMDFINYNLNEYYDMIIFPYSTLQFNYTKSKLNQIIKKIYKIINRDTVVLLDLSESFNTKIEKNNILLFEKNSKQLNDDIKVYYTSKRCKNYIKFTIEYHLVNNNKSVFEIEKYSYYNKKALINYLEKSNLNIIKIDNGYGKKGFEHKHIYHVKKSVGDSTNEGRKFKTWISNSKQN